VSARETLDAKALLHDNENLREQQRALSLVLRALARGRGLQPVLDEVVDAAARLCGGEYGSLYLAEGDVLRAFSHFIATDSESAVAKSAPEQWRLDAGRPHPRDRTTIAGRVALSGHVVHLPDMLADREYSFPLPGGSRAGLGVPIVVETELIGVIVVVRALERPFDDDSIELVKAFADQAAIAIANARLIEAVEHQLEQQRAIGDVLGIVARAERLDAVFNLVVETAARLCSAEYGQICLADGDVFRLAGSYGAAPEVVAYEEANPMPRDRSTAVGRVGVTRDVVHIPDVLVDPEYSWGSQDLAGYRATLGVPIVVEDELTGVINVVRNEPLPFSDQQIELVKTFADQAAIAIANARLIESVERQRTELSRFVSPQVAELVSSEDGEKMLAGHRAYVTSMFCDLRGFTSFTETAEPEELFEVLREYHLALGELIPRYQGTLEHFAGDGLMVFFNDPLPVDDHELKAVQLALAAQERFQELASSWSKRGHELGLGVGIASGYATLGRIGFEGRYDYGVLGTVTNLASRLSTHAEPGQTLISQRVYAAVEERVEALEVGELELKGFGRPVPAFEVRALTA
jgi:class 3 adenylate cyclase